VGIFMRALMGLIKDRHGTYYARHKVPERLQEAVARILDNGKARQVWLKKSLGTKMVAQANVRAKPVQMDFDRIIAKAEAHFKERPLRTSLSDIEIKRIADFFYAHELADDEELRIDGRGDDPMYVSIHKQLTEDGIEFPTRHDLKTLTLEPGRGLSPRMMEKIREDTEFVLAATQDALARGDIKHIRYEVDELLKVFQINLDPSCGDYLKLARAIQVAFVKQLKAVLARHRGEPVETPALIEPNQDGWSACDVCGADRWRRCLNSFSVIALRVGASCTPRCASSMIFDARSRVAGSSVDLSSNVSQTLSSASDICRISSGSNA
jgi:hypothetical protein